MTLVAKSTGQAPPDLWKTNHGISIPATHVKRDCMPSFYQRASCLCCTSMFAGFPNTLLEAWSYGLPVVSTFDPPNLIAECGFGTVAKRCPGIGQRNLWAARIAAALTGVRAGMALSGRAGAPAYVAALPGDEHGSLRDVAEGVVQAAARL